MWPDSNQWAAGFYEGEGSIVVREGKYLGIVIKQKDKEPLEIFQSIIGKHIGKIVGPQPSNNLYSYDVGRMEDVLYLIAQIYSFLSERRKIQINEKLERVGLLTIIDLIKVEI